MKDDLIFYVKPVNDNSMYKTCSRSFSLNGKSQYLDINSNFALRDTFIQSRHLNIYTYDDLDEEEILLGTVIGSLIDVELINYDINLNDGRDSLSEFSDNSILYRNSLMSLMYSGKFSECDNYIYIVEDVLIMNTDIQLDLESFIVLNIPSIIEDLYNIKVDNVIYPIYTASNTIIYNKGYNENRYVKLYSKLIDLGMSVNKTDFLSYLSLT